MIAFAIVTSLRAIATIIHTRFDAIEWLVWDANLIDEAIGLAVIIRQAPTLDEALWGAMTNQSTRRVRAVFQPAGHEPSRKWGRRVNLHIQAWLR